MEYRVREVVAEIDEDDRETDVHGEGHRGRSEPRHADRCECTGHEPDQQKDGVAANMAPEQA